MAEDSIQINTPAWSPCVYPISQRDIPDRRQRPTPVLSRYTFWGQRRHNRRGQDAKQNYYADRFQPKIMAWALLILAFSTLDGLFTLYHISQGATGANPLLNFCLSQGWSYFLALKTLITATGLFILNSFWVFLPLRCHSRMKLAGIWFQN